MGSGDGTGEKVLALSDRLEYIVRLQVTSGKLQERPLRVYRGGDGSAVIARLLNCQIAELSDCWDAIERLSH